MPSTTPKQRRFMSAAAHNPAFAEKAGIPTSVAARFHNADMGRPEDAKVPRRHARLDHGVIRRKPFKED